MKVSVVVPIYNVQAYLEQAVESIFKTNYENLEVLLVEDGSEDETLDVAKAIQARNPDRIKLLRHRDGKNRGAGASRNLGILAARGQVITFLDGDDWYYPNRFGTCVSIMKENVNIDAVYGACRVVYCDSSYGTWTDGGDMRLQGRNDGLSLFSRLLRGNSSWHINSIMYRTSFLRQIVGPFNENLRLGQDLELSLRASLVGRFEDDGESEPVAAYRRHESNRYAGGFSLSWHQTCIKVYCSTRRWMLKKRLSQESIDILDQWLRSSTFGRSDLWIQKGKKKVARKLLILLGREYPTIMFERQYWANLLKVI